MDPEAIRHGGSFPDLRDFGQVFAGGRRRTQLFRLRKESRSSTSRTSASAVIASEYIVVVVRRSSYSRGWYQQ